jgi:putative membrane protein
MAMGSALMLGACGGNDSATTDSAAPGTVSAADSTGAMAGGAMGGDSMAGMNHNAGGMLSEPNIVAMIGLSNAAEIQTSTIAQDKATNAEVKAFARDMIREHKAMQAQADSLTAKNNMQPQAPAQGDQKQQMVNTATQQLQSTAKGAEFDRAYMTAQVQMHQQTLTELQSYQGMVQNAELRAMIEKAIPAVQQHLQRAQTIQGQLGS